MDINTLNEQEYVDMFSTPGAAPVNVAPQPAKFGTEELDTDILPLTQPTVKPQEVAPAGGPEVKTEENKEEPKVEENKEADTDILGTDPKPGRKPKYDFTDASGYFADRFKSGKFVAIEEEGEDGSKKPFIPKTPEEFDEVIDIQVNYKLEQERKQLEEKIYTSKSPAWQAVLKYSEMTDDPSEIIPFIQGIKNIESVSSIDDNEIDGAEQIVRIRMEQARQPKDIIDTQIEALKTTDKLIETAKKLKPVIVEEEKRQLVEMKRREEEEVRRYVQLVDDIRESAVKTIEAPLFGKQKLKNDEKAAIYELIAEPDDQTKGYPIYTAIDNLYEKGDFEKLRKIALLLQKEESFVNYISASAADKTAESFQKKLRVATDNRSGTNDSDLEERKTTVSRKQYNAVPRFGR